MKIRDMMKKIILIIMGLMWGSLYAMEPTIPRKVSIDEWQPAFDVRISLDEKGNIAHPRFFVSCDDCVTIAEMLSTTEYRFNRRAVYVRLMRYSLGDLKNLLTNLCNLQIKTTHPLAHLVAQALVKKYRETGEYTPDFPENFKRLFADFDEKFSSIAPSLKMYMFLNLPLGERVVLSSYVGDDIDVPLFMEQNPYLDFLQEDINQINMFSSFVTLLNFSRSDELKNTTSFFIKDDLKSLRENGYDIFWKAFADRGKREANDWRDMVAEALLDRSTIMMRHLLEERKVNPHYVCHRRAILFSAAMMRDEKMVELLLEKGASPLLGYDGWDDRSILERFFEICDAGGSDEVMDKIAQMMIRNAWEFEKEDLFAIMREKIELCSRIKHFMSDEPSFEEQYSVWLRNQQERQRALSRPASYRVPSHSPSHLVPVKSSRGCRGCTIL